MYVRIAIVIAACLLGYFVGAGLTAGEYDRKLLDQALGYAEQWQRDLETARTDAEAQRKQDVAAATKRAQRSAAAKAVIHEIHTAPPGADWTDSERLRLERLYAAHGFNPDGTAIGLPRTLPAAPQPRDGAQ